ncbi:MAG: amidohydrolase family protein [Clostridiales bacterium]|nr:amidohydrolase family protein [Clostridiales bacterium]
MIYDAHLHRKNLETGGFLIGLEGLPLFKEKVLSNTEALSLHDPNKHYVAFYYVSKHECETVTISHKYLKYHPKREQYTPLQVIASIRRNSPKAVIIDTLNEPYWRPYDYWEVAQEFPELPFVFAHSGGYSINDFVKICHLQKNVWIDFSLTHATLGNYGSPEKGLPYVEQAIKYSLNSPFKSRVLLASDFPFFSQAEVFQYYAEYIDQLNNNFLELFHQIV